MARFKMGGAQPIKLSTGVTVSPGAADFDAELDPGEEDFLTRIGAIRRVASAAAPSTPPAPAAKHVSEQ